MTTFKRLADNKTKKVQRKTTEQDKAAMAHNIQPPLTPMLPQPGWLTEVSRPTPSPMAQRSWQRIHSALGQPQPGQPGQTNPLQRRLATGHLPSVLRKVGSSRPGLNLKIQRMAFQNTNWEGATAASISSGGGGGVFIFRDRSKTPVVVKPGEQFAEEGALFNELFQDVITNQNLDKAGGKKGKDWQLKVANMRIADQNESTRIKNVLDNLLPDSPSDKRISNGKQALLDTSRPTTVYAYAQGQDFSKYSSKTKQGQTPPDVKDRIKAVSALWSNSGLLTLLGRATAIDIFTGNTDRMIMFNPDNFMVDITSRTKSVTLIDNIFDQAQQGGTFADKAQFLAWIAKQIPTTNTLLKPVDEFINNNFDLIANEIIDSMAFETQQGVYSFLDQSIIGVMQTGFQNNGAQMKQWFSSGLQQGKLALIGSISGIEQRLRNQNPKGRAKQVLQHLVARKLVLSGTNSDTAWRAAHRADFTIGSRN